jgi:hypothetical protein
MEGDPMPQLRRILMAALSLLLVTGPFFATAARSADITLSHAALERVVWQVLLTQGGRGYFEGGPGETCRYAFVQEPRVSGAAGRLHVRFLFSGRAGAQVGERCVGPGDTFDIAVSGVPALTAGELYLEDLRVEAPDTVYFRLVSGLVESQLRQRLRYPLKQDLDRVVATVGAPAGYAMSVDSLEMNRVEVDEEALRVSLDLGLGIR